MFVCRDCFGDDDLRNFAEFAAAAKQCDFCGAQSNDPIAAPLNDVAERIFQSLSAEFENPANSLPYDSGEGGYQGITYSTEELLRDEIGLDLPRDDGRLLEALTRAIDDLEESPQLWSERDPFGLPLEEGLQLSWRAFTQFVMHHRRFFFRQTDLREQAEDPEQLTPDELLRQITGYAIDVGLVERLPVGIRIYRARNRRMKFPLTAAELGPPPPEKATQNRMSPAGIAMLHAAEDKETAVTEVYSDPGEYAIGRFITTRDALILNLHTLPEVPGFFSEDHAWERHPLKFLRAFGKDVSRPIVQDGRIHIEYVPTQVLTEYLKTQVTVEDTRIDGIAFTSSRTGRRNYTLFVTQDNVANGDPGRAAGEDKWVRFEGATVERIPSSLLQRILDKCRTLFLHKPA